MVRIPDRPYAYLAEGRLNPGASASGQAVASALGRAGDKLVQTALILQERRDHDLLVEAQNRYTDGMNKWSLAAEQERQGGAAAGYTRDWSGRHELLSRQVEKEMREAGLSSNGERSFRTWLGGRQSVGLAEAARYEHGQMQVYAQDQHNLRVQDIADGLGRNPAAFGDAFGQLEESFALAVGQGIYRPEEAQLLYRQSRDKLAVQAFENLYAQNRGLAMNSLEALGFDPSQQAKAQARLQADLRSEGALARARRADQAQALSRQVEDVDYLAAQSGEVGNLRNLAGQYEALGESEMAAKLYQRADLYESNQAAIKESRVMPLPELAGEINRLDGELERLSLLSPSLLSIPVKARFACPTGTLRALRVGSVRLGDSPTAAALADAEIGGAGESSDLSTAADLHRMASAELELRVGIFEERRKALLTDPALAVAGEADASVPDGLEAGEAWLARANLRLAAQANNGVPEAGRKVLTASEAARWRAEWTGGDAASRLGLIEIIQAHGKLAPNVAAEIGLSPTERLAIARGIEFYRVRGGRSGLLNDLDGNGHILYEPAALASALREIKIYRKSGVLT